MKFSIRFSISSLFVMLLLIIAAVIITINVVLMNDIILSSAKSKMTDTSHLITLQINHYLDRFKNQIDTSTELANRGIIGFDKKETLKNFLIKLVADEPNMSGAYLSGPKGNMYFIEKDLVKPDAYHLKEVNRDANPPYNLDEVLNRQGKVLSAKKTFNVTYDPRIRPFYLTAVKKEKFGWSGLYKFQLTPTGEDVYGMTASQPIYNPDGTLKFVISIDTSINMMTKFVADLQMTPNTFIFIMDNSRNVVTGEYGLKDRQGNKCDNRVCHFDQMDIPWIKESLQLFQQEQQPFISYQYQNKKYFAYYQYIKDLFKGDTLVGIVLPINDVIGPLKQDFWISLIVTVIFLIFALIIVRFIASRISKPIVKLAEDATTIAHMDFTKEEQWSSYIKEVSVMNRSFRLMRHALQSFARYLPFVVVKRLVQTGEIATVGGKSRIISILFSDIQNFTSLSEKMSPTEVMKYLSEYFEAMTTTVQSTRGVVDKYIGDGLMAFWNAPQHDEDHAIHACQTALLMQQSLTKLNQKWQSEGKPTIQIRIGINTADVVVGNVGSQSRLSYTVIGDGVNLASRLEALNKVYQTSILVSESTYQLVQNQFNCRYIDEVTVKGKTVSSNVYELIDEKIKPYYRILQLSDFHLLGDKKKTFLGTNTYLNAKKMFEKVQADIKEHQPDLIVLTGDISQDHSANAYRNLTQLLDTIDIPKIWIPGNHDDFEKGNAVFSKHNIANKSSMMLGNWRLILLNSQLQGKIEGYLSEEELSRLKNLLEESKDKNVAIFIHHHPISTQLCWLDNSILTNADEFRAIIEQYPQVKVVFFGHIHSEIKKKNKITYISAPAVGFQFDITQKDFKLDNKMPGYRSINLYSDGKVKTEVIRLEYDKKLLPDLDLKGY